MKTAVPARRFRRSTVGIWGAPGRLYALMADNRGTHTATDWVFRHQLNAAERQAVLKFARLVQEAEEELPGP